MVSNLPLTSLNIFFPFIFSKHFKHTSFKFRFFCYSSWECRFFYWLHLLSFFSFMVVCFFFFPFSSPLFEGVFLVCSFQQDLSSQRFLCENLVKRISLLTVLCLLPKDPTIAQDWLFVNFSCWHCSNTWVLWIWTTFSQMANIFVCL